MKKVISCMLCALFLFSQGLVAFAVDADNSEMPEIYFYTEAPVIENGYSDINREAFGGMLLRGEIRNCENLESCEVAIRYDPWILNYDEKIPNDIDWQAKGFLYSISSEPAWVERNVYEMVMSVERMGDGITVAANGGIAQSSMVRVGESVDATTQNVVQWIPFQFYVRNPGATELTVEVLSWTDTEGNTIEGKITVDESVQYAMSAEDYIAMTTNPTCLQSSTIRGHWYSSDKLTVAQVKENAPDAAEVVILNAEQNRVLADDEYIATGCYYTVYKNGMQCFSTKLLVLNDITGDGFVSSEDARLALRFAVGLDTPTDDQRYAAGLTGSGEFTSALARDILRYAVGLAA